MKLKYSIKEKCVARGTDSGRLIADLCNVSTVTAYNWLNIKSGEDRSIPSDALRKIAVYLDTSMESLYYQHEVEIPLEN